jgi:hypothetical protein
LSRVPFSKPVTPSLRDRWANRSRAGTLRTGSASSTPGRCSMSWNAAGDPGSLKITSASWRCTRFHWKVSR